MNKQEKTIVIYENVFQITGDKQKVKHLYAGQKESEIRTNNFERDVIVNGTHIRVKSIFNGKLSLEKALSNLVLQKISNRKKA